MITSPGTGVQHLASFTITSSIPSTSTALEVRRAIDSLDGISMVGSGWESSTPSRICNLSITAAADICPSPTAA